MTKVEKLMAQKAIKDAARKGKRRADKQANIERKARIQRRLAAIAADQFASDMGALVNGLAGVILPDGAQALWSGLAPREKFTVEQAIANQRYTVSSNKHLVIFTVQP
jgi:hypothetical protein